MYSYIDTATHSKGQEAFLSLLANNLSYNKVGCSGILCDGKDHCIHIGAMEIHVKSLVQRIHKKSE